MLLPISQVRRNASTMHLNRFNYNFYALQLEIYDAMKANIKSVSVVNRMLEFPFYRGKAFISALLRLRAVSASREQSYP
jgi:hypothetical protein